MENICTFGPHASIVKLLTIRQIQLKRELEEAGAGILLVVCIIAGLICGSYSYYKQTSSAYFETAFLFLLCLLFQVHRKDKLFVYNHLEHSHKEFFWEYVVFTCPFALPALLTPNWFCYPVFITALAFLPFIRYSLPQKNYFKSSSSFFRPADFEWISGVRKSFFFLFLFYILAIAFCWFRFVPMILLWFITILFTSFYNECEPLHILKEGNRLPAELLKQKMFRHSSYLVLFYFPILLINTFFYPDFVEMNLLVIPTHIALLCFSICLKYSNYQPNQHSIVNAILLALVSLCTIVPYLLPIPLLMSGRYYQKAKKNLENYLYD